MSYRNISMQQKKLVVSTVIKNKNKKQLILLFGEENLKSN